MKTILSAVVAITSMLSIAHADPSADWTAATHKHAKQEFDQLLHDLVRGEGQNPDGMSFSYSQADSSVREVISDCEMGKARTDVYYAENSSTICQIVFKSINTSGGCGVVDSTNSASCQSK